MTLSILFASAKKVYLHTLDIIKLEDHHIKRECHNENPYLLSATGKFKIVIFYNKHMSVYLLGIFLLGIFYTFTFSYEYHVETVTEIDDTVFSGSISYMNLASNATESIMPGIMSH